MITHWMISSMTFASEKLGTAAFGMSLPTQVSAPRPESRLLTSRPTRPAMKMPTQMIAMPAISSGM